MTKECSLAWSRIVLVSSNSTKKVDLFSKSLSLAPILVKTRSTIERLHFSAGTKHPIYAIIVAIQVYLKKVDFPPIFGPVTNRNYD